MPALSWVAPLVYCLPLGVSAMGLSPGVPYASGTALQTCLFDRVKVKTKWIQNLYKIGWKGFAERIVEVTKFAVWEREREKV